MMRKLALVLLGTSLALASCSKDADGKVSKTDTVAPVTAGKTDATGVRRIPVEAGSKGYAPAKIMAKPGEKLILVMTRTQEGECLSQIQLAGGPLVDLPMNKAVEIPVTAPASGELGFACGMNMFHGMIVAN